MAGIRRRIVIVPHDNLQVADLRKLVRLPLFLKSGSGASQPFMWCKRRPQPALFATDQVLRTN